MKTEFLEYFKTMGIREPIQKRIESIYEYFESLVPKEKFVDVFVNDYVQADGTRIYADLRLYSEKRAALATDFITTNDFKVGAEGRTFEVANLRSQNYDFKKATGESRLNLVAWYSNIRFRGAGMYLQGSGENCDYLMKIYYKHILPRLVSVGAREE